MAGRKIGCLPVLDGESLVGLLSESDIAFAVSHSEL
jgi:CBS domain-containing protein